MKTKIMSIILVCALFVGMLVSMPTTAYASSTAIRGQSTIDQTVYYGPSTGGYVSVGSMEELRILDGIIFNIKLLKDNTRGNRELGMYHALQ